jgi:multidrug efflux pump subunit AcrB
VKACQRVFKPIKLQKFVLKWAGLLKKYYLLTALKLMNIPQLPIACYPSVALPQISIIAIYPGATPQTLNDSVISLIEDEITSLRAL